MSSGRRWWIAASLALVALVSNQWVAEAILDRFSLGFVVAKPPVFWNILSFQLLTLTTALLVLRRRTALRIAWVALLTAVACLATYNVTKFVDLMRRRPQETPTQVMLTAVEALHGRKLATLEMETAEILYGLHEDTLRSSFRVPDGAVLDTGLGVDPRITGLYQGKVHFEIALVRESAPPQRLFFEEIDLSSPASFWWRPVTLDLARHAGEEITLAFAKGFSPSPDHPPRAVYDLLPVDFMFWRVPQVRPRRLAGRRNVVLIVLDTLRADHLHYMGYPRETSPHLDGLARAGAVFTTTVSQAPWTTPAHFSLLTSTYPSVHRGNQSPEVPGRTWNDRLPTMASILREEGYLTAAFTGRGNISAILGFFKGFDFYNETAPDLTGSDIGPIMEKTIRWLRESGDRSFFLFLHSVEPHAPYRGNYFVEREGIRPDDELAYRTARYDGNIRRGDAFVGEILGELERLGLLDNTLLVFTSDHGEDLIQRYSGDPAPDHGHTLYDDVLLVPLVFHAPGRIPAGKRIDHQVRSIDILPTILDYLELDPEALGTFQGQSLKRMIEGTDQTPRLAYSEATTWGAERESLRTGDYKYIRRLSYGTLAEAFHFRDLPLAPVDELYDLKADPGETVNLADEQPELLEELREKLLELLPERRTDAPEKETPSSEGSGG
ncbi:MAG: sulfatase-like hydrolase/transferase [bacterium]|nr:sulfatase-like hydrolase/transferase [bacterium]